MVLECSKLDVPLEVACEPHAYFRSLLLGFFSEGETGAEKTGCSRRLLSQSMHFLISVTKFLNKRDK